MSFKEFNLGGFTYRSSKPLFLFGGLVLLAFIVFCLYTTNFSGKTFYYSSCPNDSISDYCFNQFYNSNLCVKGKIASDNVLCTEEKIAKGDAIGEYPPFFIRYFNLIAWSILFCILFVNTVLFNKGFFVWAWSKLRG